MRRLHLIQSPPLPSLFLSIHDSLGPTSTFPFIHDFFAKFDTKRAKLYENRRMKNVCFNSGFAVKCDVAKSAQ